MEIIGPASIDPDWNNVMFLSGDILGDEACSGGTLDGTFHGPWADDAVLWEDEPRYRSDGNTRYVAGTPRQIGSAENPACCGGTITWQGWDGCEKIVHSTTTVIPKVGSPMISPAEGTVLHEFEELMFSGSPACSYSEHAELTLDSECLSNETGSAERYPGYLTGRFSGGLAFSGDHKCSGCCGAGRVYVTFKNGCGPSIQAQYRSKTNPCPRRIHGPCGQAFQM